jgi:predicted DNA-binding transcriptional regulator AlpA
MPNQTISLNYAPLGMSREEVAQHIGIGTTLFDKMVADGRMPPPKCINTRRVWNRIAIEQAFAELPDDSRPANDDNPWDQV